MLCINSVPPQSVDRTYFHVTVTLSRSRGLVNLVARERLKTAALRMAIVESKHADCDQAWLPRSRDYPGRAHSCGSHPRTPSGEANGFALP